MPRFSLIRNIYSLASLGFSKKIKFICEVGIFFILAALISSIISIYFETKLMKYNNDFIQLELEESSIQEWMTLAPEKNLRNRMRKFYFQLLKEDNKKFAENKKGYHFYILTKQKNEIADAIKSTGSKLEKIESNNFTDQEKTHLRGLAADIEKWSEDYMFMMDFVYDPQFKKGFDYSESFFDTIEFSTIKNHISSNENTYSQVNLFFREYNKIIDLKKIELKKKISLANKRSSDLILYAFLMQLLIFVIIQFLELREVSREKKNTK